MIVYWVFSELLEMQPYAPHIYLGADDIQEEGKFVWVATVQPVTYTNWAPSATNASGDCVAL